MRLYILPDWVPFPSSEYGGLLIYCARNREELRDMLINDSDEYDIEDYSDYQELIEDSIKRVIEYDIGDQEEDPKLITSFIT